ncbi:hypothetical protein HYU14_00845 [Candidatus Woesearchaeota archaeon]|nr:hypothetical protein [Candidatus Woesearchaeota archaeon]
MTAKNKTAQALFLITLVLTLPFYSSLAYASLSSPSVKGADGFPGFVRGNEQFQINVTAFIAPNEVITPNQLSTVDVNGPPFDSCLDIGSGNFQCIKAFDASTLSQNPFTLNIKLFRDGGSQESNLLVNGIIDQLPPIINTFAITPQKTSSGNISLQWSVTDVSHSPAALTQCTGIKKVEFSSSERGVFRSIPLNSFPVCGRSRTESIPVSLITGSDGNISVTLRVFDGVNLQSAQESTFVFDTTPPSIVVDSLKIVDNAGNDLSFLTNISALSSIKFKINANDLNVSSVSADISSLSTDPPADFRKKPVGCIRSAFDEFNCSIAGIPVSISQSLNAQIIVNASDALGNKQTAQLAKQLNFDNLGPVVASITTDFRNAADGRSFAGKKTNFFVTLAEGGVGVDKNDVRLDLSSVNSALASASPDECVSSGNEITCVFANITPTASDGVRPIRVLSSSRDRLGNPVSGALEENITIDTTLPKIEKFSAKALATGTSTTFPPFLKTGDAFAFEVNVTEKNDFTIKADFSNIVTTMQEPVAGQCSVAAVISGLAGLGGNVSVCAWNTNPIDVQGPINSNILINVTDAAGNSKIGFANFTVLQFDDAEVVNHWTSRVECSPSLVDRQITPLINAKVYCQVRLQPLSNDQEVLDIKLNPSQCESVAKDSLDFVDPEGFELTNGNRGATEPFVSFRLAKGEMEIDRLEFRCPLEIITRAGQTINKNPEVEEVTLQAGFYNNPLGQFGDEVKKEIKDAKDIANNIGFKIVGYLKEIVKYATMICNLIATVEKLWWAIHSFTKGMTTAHLAAVGPAEVALGQYAYQGCVQDQFIQKYNENLYTGFSSFCKYVNCQYSPASPQDPSKGGQITSEKTKMGKIHDFFNSWQTKGNNFFGKISPATETTTTISLLGTNLIGRKGTDSKFRDCKTIEECSGKQPSQYMNARDNLGVALMTGCIPGIINGLDNIRQLFCLKADCLQDNARNNVPIKECNDQFWYATCKYIIGEVFSFFPPFAFFFRYVGYITEALSDPITAVFTLLNIFFQPCQVECKPDKGGSVGWVQWSWFCGSLQVATYIGEIINDVQGIIDTFKDEKIDYCERID